MTLLIFLTGLAALSSLGDWLYQLMTSTVALVSLALLGDPRSSLVGFEAESLSIAFFAVAWSLLIGKLLRDRMRLKAELQATRKAVQNLVYERVEERACSHEELSFEFNQKRLISETLRLRELALEVLPQGVVITDTRQNNIITYANPGFYRLTGYSAEEVIGRNCRFLQGPETSEVTVAQLRQAIQSRQPKVVEIQNYRKDGTMFWNALTIAPITDEYGECRHFVGIQIDVTEFKKIEEQFRQSQKMEAIGHLASGVAHDFNNLLTVINGCSELVRMSLPGDDPQLPFIDEIYQAGTRAAGLTRQLLTFSRKTTVQPQLVDLNRSLGDLEKMLRRLITENIRLTLSLAPDLPTVRIDPGLFEQVVINLVVNARDAMPQGGDLRLRTGLVELAEPGLLHPQQKPGAFLRLEVQDSGIGMDRATQNRIFEPFFTTKPAGKGTGLGLATVYGIVQSSDGFIGLRSALGQGTTFVIHLPVCAEPAASTPGSSSTLSAIRLPRVERVMVVEDEEGVRTLARQTLRKHGFEVYEAPNGKDAIELMNRLECEIDLLLTDVVMPEMGGRELSERLRLDSEGLKVIYMSGYNDDAVLQQGISQSEMHFLQKPFTVNDLLGKVRAVLDEPPVRTVVPPCRPAGVFATCGSD